ncbi:hypothetical protein ABBQ38_010721 [Trebouxia sp. C0009 RCD-2024]
MVHLPKLFFTAVSVAVGFAASRTLLVKRHNRTPLSPDEIRATSGAAAEQRQRQYEEKQRRRTSTLRSSWSGTAVGSKSGLPLPQPTASAGSEPGGSSVASGSNNTDNPFWSPAQYIPAEAAEADLSLYTKEVALVLDSGLVGHPGSAILDTGNDGCTLITLEVKTPKNSADLQCMALLISQVPGMLAVSSTALHTDYSVS